MRVLVTDARGRRVPAAGLAGWLCRVAPSRARGTLNVAIVSDRDIQRLNREFRGIDRATDVLSFPVRGTTPTGRKGDAFAIRPPVEPFQPIQPSLGEIVIARGVARRQARMVGHAEHVEWRVLALHGLLHLLGYDHDEDDGRMQRIERRLRRKGGLRQGLIDRAQ